MKIDIGGINMFKRLFSLMLVLLCISTVTGCGTKDGLESYSNGDSTSEVDGSSDIMDENDNYIVVRHPLLGDNQIEGFEAY